MPRKKSIRKKIKKYFKGKGFTLIELLAVVVILGLLVAIAYPAVNKYILETKDTTYTLHESDMKTAAKNMMSECIQNDTADCVPESGESKTIYLSELIDTKYSNPIKDPDKKDGYCKNDRSYVIVTNTGDSTVKLDYQVCLTCDKYASGKCSELEPGGTCDSTTDTTSPTCGEVVGGSTLWTNKDRVISVKCNDVGCGCTKKSFYKTFKENSQKGSITITDKAGNSTECEVNVYIDKDLPTCELEVIGNIGENEWYGNDAPIVRFKSKTDDLSGIATYGMGLSSKNPDFNKKDSYTAPTGISTIYGYVKDNAGNVGTCHVEVKYDSVPATLDKTDYGSIVYPKSDIASVDSNKRIITLDKTILDEYGDIYGLYFYQKSTSTGMTVTAKTGAATVKTVTLSSGVTKPIRILFDSAIRIGEYNLTIDLGANNKVDSISRIEVITRNDTVGYYTNQDVTLYINSHDSLSGKAYYTFNGTTFQEDPYYTFTQNTNAVGVGIKDHAGNITDITELKITNIDKIKPSCEVIKSRTKDGNGTDWYNKSVDILFKSGAQVDAAATSAYAMSEVRDWSLNNTTGRGNPKSRTQSAATVSTIDTGYVIDNAGNINTCSSTVKLDLTDPIAGTVTMTAGGSSISSGAEVNQNVTVTLANGSDTGSVQSGHYTTKFTVVRDGTTVSNSITGSETYTAEGNYTVTVRTEDQSGRYSTRSYTFMIDKTAPNCGSVTNGSTTWTNTSRTLSVGCADSSGVAKSGCTQTTYSTNYTTSTKTSTITIKDEAGNTKACPVNVYIDVDYPTCASNNGSTTWTTSDRTITVNCSDTGGSNCTQSSYSSTYTTSTKTSSIDIRDVAGNVTTCPINVYVDKTPPSCDSNNGSTTWTNADRTITVNCGDGHSGCVQSTYSKSYSTSTKTDSITIKDNVGHTTTCPINVYVDKGVPTCGTVSGSSTTWTNSNRTISVGCSDTGGSGCTSSSFSYTWSSSKQTSAITIRDAAGNSRSCSVNVYVDKDAPTCGTKTGTSTTWTASNRTIKVNCSDTGGSGCESSSFSKTYSTTTTTGTITLKDNAGNTTGCSVNVYVDKTPPTCTMTKHTSVWNNVACGTCGVCGEIKCTDSHSGVDLSGTGQFYCYTHTDSWVRKDLVGNSTTVYLSSVSSKKIYRRRYCSTYNTKTQTDSCTYGGVTVCGTKKCDGYTASQCSCTEEVSYWSGSCSIKCSCSKEVTDTSSCKKWGSWSSWSTTNYCSSLGCEQEEDLTYY